MIGIKGEKCMKNDKIMREKCKVYVIKKLKL
jgi:hypothetical protein